MFCMLSEISAARARSDVISSTSLGVFISPFCTKMFLVRGLGEIAWKSSAFFAGVCGRTSTVFLTARVFAILFLKAGLAKQVLSSPLFPVSFRISPLRFSRNRWTLSRVCCRILFLLLSASRFSSCFCFVALDFEFLFCWDLCVALVVTFCSRPFVWSRLSLTLAILCSRFCS